ncbi:hypothetical protein GCM10018953_06380 [Streptosporangium nondiastaticum]
MSVVFRRHYAHYTPEMVERICGIPRELFAEVCRHPVENSGPERTAEFVYAVGWIQHSDGSQFIRAACVLQLLLGNMGRPGGGIQALRGHASIQGSSDIPTLFNLLPGYIPMPHAHRNPPAPRAARPTPSSSASWTSCATGRPGVWSSSGTPG